MIREILAQPITASDARQLGFLESTNSTDVSPAGALMNLSRPWVQNVVDQASDDELLAIGALEDAGWIISSSLVFSFLLFMASKSERRNGAPNSYDLTSCLKV